MILNTMMENPSEPLYILLISCVCDSPGADVVDVAVDAMSGLTSQPSMGAIVNSVKDTILDTGLNFDQVYTVTSKFVVGNCIVSQPL